MKKPIIVLCWAALWFIPVICVCLIFLGHDYIAHGQGLHPFLAGAAIVLMFGAGWGLACILDEFDK